MGNQETSSPGKQVTFVLTEDLHKRFRIAVMNEGKTMQGMLEHVVQRYVEREEAKADG